MNTRRDFVRGLTGIGAIVATGHAPAIVRSALAARGTMLGGEKKEDVPYDAEVDFIETDGVGSYIDTGVFPVLVSDEYSVVSVEFAFRSWRPDNTNFICGARHGTTATATSFGIAAYASSANKIYLFKPTISASSPLNPIDTVRHKVSMRNGFAEIDGEDISVSRDSNTSHNATSGFCLGTSGAPSMHPSGVAQFGNARFYSCKIVTGGVTVFDGRPVRKDGHGYIYDSISGSLLGNAGAGELIYG